MELMCLQQRQLAERQHELINLNNFPKDIAISDELENTTLHTNAGQRISSFVRIIEF